MTIVLPEECGWCEWTVDPATEVRIRSLDAPNPFCCRGCAEAWERWWRAQPQDEDE